MNYIYILDITGTLVFAISGALTAAERRMDLMGISIIAFVTALGGGTLRDILIGAHPVGWMENTDYLIVVALGVSITFLFARRLVPLRRTFFLFDAIGLGVFAIGGLEKALSYGISPIYAVICGMISATMGGLLRDVLCNEVPLILRQEIYATAGFIGAALYLLMGNFTIMPELRLIFTISLVVAIRIIAVRYRLGLPRMEKM